jgi:ligand-binding SRPBCC domain-containing protein
VTYVLTRTHEIRASLEDVFAFFSDPANLSRITPEWLRFRIHGEKPARLTEGSRIEYRIVWTILTLRWVTRIDRWDPPRRFVDAQERGPYRKWVHTHTFTPTASGVRMEDRVEYELPFGPLGRVVHALRVRRQLEEIFDFRRRAIDDVFFSGAKDLAVPPTPGPIRGAAVP